MRNVKILLGILVVLLLVGCGSKGNEPKLSGTVTLSGSTSMEKVCEALSEKFMDKYPDITVSVEYTGSSAGIEAVTNGKSDIGNSSRNLKDSELANGVEGKVIAIDGIAVIVDKNNGIDELTKEQLVSIFDGTVKNWTELGGNDEPIVVVGREAASGTRSAFEELLGLSNTCQYAQELDSTGAVLARVSSTSGAIGYVSLDVVNQDVKALSLDGVEPTEANITAGKYILSRPFLMVTKGTVDAQNDLVKLWFSYIESPEGQDVIKSIGLILPD